MGLGLGLGSLLALALGLGLFGLLGLLGLRSGLGSASTRLRPRVHRARVAGRAAAAGPVECHVEETGRRLDIEA